MLCLPCVPPAPRFNNLYSRSVSWSGEAAAPHPAGALGLKAGQKKWWRCGGKKLEGEHDRDPCSTCQRRVVFSPTQTRMSSRDALNGWKETEKNLHVCLEIKQEARGGDLLGFLPSCQHPDRESQPDNERFSLRLDPRNTEVDLASSTPVFQGKNLSSLFFLPLVPFFYTLPQAFSPFFTGLS